MRVEVEQQDEQKKRSERNRVGRRGRAQPRLLRRRGCSASAIRSPSSTTPLRSSADPLIEQASRSIHELRDGQRQPRLGIVEVALALHDLEKVEATRVAEPVCARVIVRLVRHVLLGDYRLRLAPADKRCRGADNVRNVAIGSTAPLCGACDAAHFAETAA